MSKPLHLRLRRCVMDYLAKGMAKFLPKHVRDTPLEPAEISHVLVVRINYHLGNIVRITPLINSLHERLPDAKIHVLIGDRRMASILDGLPGVKCVYDVPRGILRNPFRLFVGVRKLRETHYDLMVDPIGSSISGKLACLFLRSRWKLGFAQATSWPPLTHVVQPSLDTEHVALRPLALLQALPKTFIQLKNRLDINLTDEERCIGRRNIRTCLAQNAVPKPSTLAIGVFREARWEKRMGDRWWYEMLEAFDTGEFDYVIVDVLSRDGWQTMLPCPGVALESPDLRGLAANLSQLDLFVSGDTGPMHLASAVGVPTIGLFKSTSPRVYGPLGNHDIAIEVTFRSPQSVAEDIQHYIRRQFLQNKKKESKVTHRLPPRFIEKDQSIPWVNSQPS